MAVLEGHKGVFKDDDVVLSKSLVVYSVLFSFFFCCGSSFPFFLEIYV